ncbi:MAG: J domain-containing protein [Cytophagales bacterium]|nr:J domain-containing protein [Cytophagales bacterium]
MDCWKTLGITKTSNKEIIKSAYRTLVKKYHPDLAKTPEKVRTNTIKCAQLNLAYQEAQLEADKINEFDNSNEVVNSIQYKKGENLILRILRPIGIIIIAGLLWGLIEKLTSTIARLAKSNDIAKVIFGVPIKVFGFAFISSVISLSTGFITVLTLDFVLVKFMPEKYYYKLLWLIVVSLNTLIAVNNLIPFKVVSDESLNTTLFILIWNLWPIIFLFSWIRTIIKYNSIKDKFYIEKLS